MSKPAPGTIRFHEWCEPPLAPGDYKVSVDQTVKELDNKKFSGTFSFSVAGARFALNPADIYSVYPPEDSNGDFANSLPHIVFTRRTIPWERNIRTGSSPACGAQWLALLLLSEEDGTEGKLPPIEPRKVEDLIDSDKLRKQGIAGPKIPGLKAWELKDPCNTIDLGAALFQRIAPREAGLRYLTHVREVNTDAKETLSYLTDGWFSVAIGNRFPQTSIKDSDPPVENRALLISLEGLADYLPGKAVPLGNVRLAVLATWTFRCVKGFEFVSSMRRLDGRPLQIPFKPDSSKPQQYVGAAFSRGYAALNHNTRLGEKTVSWYRGPLTPVTIERRGRYTFAPVPDKLVQYDPEKGMMDLTYAAASQLGRLLALQDRSFASTLCAWRTRVQAQLSALLRREDLQRAMNSGVASLPGTEGAFLEGVLAAAVEEKSPGPIPPVQTFEERLKHPSGGTDPGGPDPDPNPPPAVCEWLSRRLLLYGVPFSYLVPDERMLPMGSMRFFSLDPGWIKCLLEGACSVGRGSTREQMVDEYLRDRFFDLALAGSGEVRQRPPDDGDGDLPAISGITTEPSPPVGGQSFTITLTGTNFHAARSTIHFAGPEIRSASAAGTGTAVSGKTALSAGSFIVTLKNEATGQLSKGFPLTVNPTGKQTAGSLKRPLEGFLLRSPVVKGWQGLEMEAAGDNGAVTPLRIDRLSPEIMLCIFDGPVRKIEIRQPAEGMHFGATVDGSKYRKYMLRSVTEKTATGKEPGDKIDLATPIEIPLQTGRVVDVEELAKRLQRELTATGGIAAGASFTSAEFGVQMTESPGRVTITVNRQALS